MKGIRNMYLIPQPKKMETQADYVSYTTVRPFREDIDERINKAAAKLPCSEDGARLYIEIAGKTGEGYSLCLNEHGITIKAECAQGAFYGIQTLRQILKHDKIPILYIEDKPDFEYRGFYHDITRGKVPEVKTIKSLIDTMAYYKLNSLQLYVEHTFEFEEFKDSIDKTGYLSEEEIKELDKYCYENFIDFVPSIATFGHLYELLQKDKYKHLCVLKDFEPTVHYWLNRLRHHTIDPINDESFELIKSLIDRYMSLFKTDKFNICCDETHDLEIYKEQNADPGELYIDFVKKLINYVKGKGKKVMMWTDILLKYPETIDELPKDDIYLLNWYYDDNPPENDIKLLSETNIKQIVCPGTRSWNRFCEDTRTEKININLMSEYGYKYGAVGVLNTNWGDYGNPCCLDLAMYGLVIGAAKSWTAATELNDDFDNKVNYLLYENDKAVQYLNRLSELNENIDWVTLIRHYSNCLFEEQLDAVLPGLETIVEAQAGCREFIDTLSKEIWINDEYRQEMLVSAEGICVMAELMAKEQGFEIPRMTDTKSWLLKYREKWIMKNKEYELSEIEKMFNFFEEKTQPFAVK